MLFFAEIDGAWEVRKDRDLSSTNQTVDINFGLIL